MTGPHLPELLAADGIVIDLRRNGGGNTGVGAQIAAMLSTEPMPGSAWKTREHQAAQLAWGAGAGAAALLGVVSLLARRRDDEPERGRHLAMGASAGWLALPACGAALLGFAPGGRPLAALVVLALSLSLAAAIRAMNGESIGAPAPWARTRVVFADFGPSNRSSEAGIERHLSIASASPKTAILRRK